MWIPPENGQYADELYVAGEIVPAGVYRRVGTDVLLRLDRSDRLPATLDGRVACYVIERTWSGHAVVVSAETEQHGHCAPSASSDDAQTIDISLRRCA